jgi:O-antigen/teichoic acid export membrane protein
MLSYLITALLVLALYLRPDKLLLLAAIAISCVVLLAGRYHYRRGQVHKDALMEYLLVLLAVLVVLIGALYR